MTQPDPRRYAPATDRNREPILEILQGVLPDAGLVLEVASGTGEHAAFFAAAMPWLTWQPSDPDAGSRRSIDAWAGAAGVANVRPALHLDAAAPEWPVSRADAVVCINMVHISPWESTLGLMSGAAAVLPSRAPLVLYGPYRRGDRPLEPGNAAFDQSLKARDPRWGLRDLDAVKACAGQAGLEFERMAEMPANNLSLIFRRR